MIVCLFIYSSVSLSIYPSVYTFACQFVSISIHLSIYLHISLNTYFSIYVFLTTHHSLYSSIYLPMHLFLCPSIYLSIYLHTHFLFFSYVLNSLRFLPYAMPTFTFSHSPLYHRPLSFPLPRSQHIYYIKCYSSPGQS